MNPLSRNITALLTILLAFTGTARSYADTQDYYYDGDQKIPLTRDPGLLAEFDPRDDYSDVTAALPDAKPVLATQHVIIYAVPQTAQNLEAMAGLLDRGFNVSPVYHEGDSLSGPPLALPGGAIVDFKDDWDGAHVRQWAGTNGYAIEELVALPGSQQHDVYAVIKTFAGQDSLETSNKIHESGAVVSASPNWWENNTGK
jgi:hypothetical protein